MCESVAYEFSGKSNLSTSNLIVLCSLVSCFSANTHIAILEESANSALCHCSSCQNWGGSSFSSNIVVPTPAFKLLRALSNSLLEQLSCLGSRITCSFAVVSRIPLRAITSRTFALLKCKSWLTTCFKLLDCGYIFFTQTEGVPATANIQTGSLHSPDVSMPAEIFVGGRRSYIQPLDRTVQVEKMP